jgi:hypothetical protein
MASGEPRPGIVGTGGILVGGETRICPEGIPPLCGHDLLGFQLVRGPEGDAVDRVIAENILLLWEQTRTGRLAPREVGLEGGIDLGGRELNVGIVFGKFSPRDPAALADLGPGRAGHEDQEKDRQERRGAFPSVLGLRRHQSALLLYRRSVSADSPFPRAHKKSRSTDVVDRLLNVTLTLFFSNRMAPPPGLEPEPTQW